MGNLFIADARNHRILRVDAETGIINSVVGGAYISRSRPSGDFRGDGGPPTEARLYNPSRVVLDKAGNLYILDGGNRRIRRVSFADQPPATVPAEK